MIKGTVEYLAPEILNGSLGKPNISKQDVWSIGVIAYQLCTLRLPFKNEHAGATAVAILNNPHDPIPHKLYSDELKDIINKLLTKDPEQRPSIQELTKVPIIREALEILIKEFEAIYGGRTPQNLRKTRRRKKRDRKNNHKLHRECQ